MLALVIDDSRAMRAILGAMLREAGFETLEAAHGGEALDRLQSRPDVALALLDWNMPVMDGFEFLQRVRARPEFDALRIMMVTTETEADQVAKALAAGANEYLMKPFPKEALFAKLGMLDVLPDSEL
ncbi:MAG TPA: response regulator [Planctomycetia bacterium]|nr:response regulator [Planctomycetia bacterium]